MDSEPAKLVREGYWNSMTAALRCVKYLHLADTLLGANW